MELDNREGGSLTSDKTDPRLHQSKPNGQNEAYLVLSKEERAKGFVRPVRASYVHVGRIAPHNLRDLDDEQKNRYAEAGYVKYEDYDVEGHPKRGQACGRYWTQKDLDALGGCGTLTTMSTQIAETYARDPKFYGSTFCCGCGTHLPVEQFVWAGTDERVGS